MKRIQLTLLIRLQYRRVWMMTSPNYESIEHNITQLANYIMTRGLIVFITQHFTVQMARPFLVVSEASTLPVTLPLGLSLSKVTHCPSHLLPGRTSYFPSCTDGHLLACTEILSSCWHEVVSNSYSYVRYLFLNDNNKTSTVRVYEKLFCNSESFFQSM